MIHQQDPPAPGFWILILLIDMCTYICMCTQTCRDLRGWLKSPLLAPVSVQLQVHKWGDANQPGMFKRVGLPHANRRNLFRVEKLLQEKLG